MRKVLLTSGISLYIALATSLAGPVALAQEPTRSDDRGYRVIGGTVAADGAWPWQVAIYKRQADNRLTISCGGSLIGERWVLTAAHCLANNREFLTPSDIVVIEGTNQIDRVRTLTHGRGRLLAVQQIVRHESYNDQTAENDIALLELASPARSPSVVLASRADTALEIVGRTSVLTGWGVLREIKPVGNQILDLHTNQPVEPGDPSYFTDRLMQTEIPLVDRDVCRQALLQSNKPIDERHICAGLKEGGKDSCQGDSGGPLVTANDRGSYTQIGIISWGRGCARPEAYGVNTRVAVYDQWIRSKTTSQPPQVAAVIPPRPPVPPQQITVAALVQSALAHDNSAALTVELVQGDVVRVGQSAQFRVTAQKAGHLVLVDITPDGTMTQIFPNARSLAIDKTRNSHLVEPNRPLLVPDHRSPYAGFEMRVVPPIGYGLLVAILSEQPLQSIAVPDTPRTMERTAAIDFVSSLAEELQRDLLVEGQPRRRNWSVAMKPYRVDF